MGAEKQEDLELTRDDADRVKGGMLGEPGGGGAGGGYKLSKKKKKRKKKSSIGPALGNH